MSNPANPIVTRRVHEAGRRLGLRASDQPVEARSDGRGNRYQRHGEQQCRPAVLRVGPREGRVTVADRPRGHRCDARRRDRDQHRDGPPTSQHDAAGVEGAGRRYVVNSGEAGAGGAGQQDATVGRWDRARPDRQFGGRRGEQPRRLFAAQRGARPDGQHLQQRIDRHRHLRKSPALSDGLVEPGHRGLAPQQPPAKPGQRASDRETDQPALDGRIPDPDQQWSLVVSEAEVFQGAHQNCREPANHPTKDAGHQDRGREREVALRTAHRSNRPPTVRHHRSVAMFRIRP